MPIVAQVIGRDVTHGLVMLEVMGSGNLGSPGQLMVGMPTPIVNLWYARLGDSSEVQADEEVLVLGSGGVIRTPLEAMIGTVRSVSLETILHDVVIDAGNSGGPIVNDRGEVVGMSFVDKGSGVALPSDVLESELERLWSGFYGVRQAELGIRVGSLPVTLTEGQQQQLPDPSQRYGVEIEEVLPGYSAEDVGLVPGDVIVAWSGDPVESGERFYELVSGLSLTRRVNLTFFRGDTVYTAMLFPQESQ